MNYDYELCVIACYKSRIKFFAKFQKRGYVQCTYQLRESKSVSWSGKTAAGEGGRAGRVAALEGEGDFGGVTVVRDVGRQRLQIRKMTAKLVVDFEISVIGLLMILFLRT